jgi:large subunit ribosomal protein L18
MELKDSRRIKRKLRIRSRVTGTAAIPRLAVNRSNAQIYAQLINDEIHKTLLAASDLDIKKGTKTEKASLVGKKIAELALKKKIKKVVFDRSGYKFHGRVKALAEGAREGGLQF